MMRILVMGGKRRRDEETERRRDGVEKIQSPLASVLGLTPLARMRARSSARSSGVLAEPATMPMKTSSRVGRTTSILRTGVLAAICWRTRSLGVSASRWAQTVPLLRSRRATPAIALMRDSSRSPAGVDFAQGVVEHFAALVNHHDAVAEGFGLAHLVG
jgi:hypothetical protein